MRRKSRTTALIAGGTALALVMLTGGALIAGSDDREESPGLTREFQRVDAEYQTATRDFVEQTKSLESADLRTALRLYGLALEAATEARAGLADLDVVDDVERPTDRMDRALQVQELALEEAVEAARARDEAGTVEASKRFQTAVLAYMAARADMLRALDACGERCR